MELWENSQNSYLNSLLNLDPSNSFFWDNNTMGVSSQSLFTSQPFNYYPDISEMEIPNVNHCSQFPPNENKDEKQEGKSEKKALSPMVASSASGSEGQHSHSDIQQEEERHPDVADVADDGGNKKTSSEGEIVDSKSKKRKRSIERGPKYAFKTQSDTDVLEDGYKWRKYGRKYVKSNPHPRSYYRCSNVNCEVKKRIERDPTDAGMLITTYEGTHNHESPSVIYYIGKPIILQQPGSKPAVVFINSGDCF